MKKIVEISLGILTAIGGFVDIGDIVANSSTGARFKMSLAWVVLVGVVGIVLYAEMAGRVATISRRPVFDIVRERLGARMAWVNLGASFFINLLTVTAEIAGVAIVLQLASDVNYLAWIPLVALIVWFMTWRVKFSVLEKVYGLLGLALIVILVAVIHSGQTHAVLSQARHIAPPKGEGLPTYFYFAIALLGAAMTPYEVFFFSSGAVEEGWTKSDLMVNRANVYIGFPLGGILSIGFMAGAAIYLAPRGIRVDTLAQAALPTTLSLGKVGLLILLFGMGIAIFGAALETALSAGYIVSQHFGWQWGKFVRPSEAPRFHLTILLTILLGAALALTTVDPVKVTEYSIVLSAAALPLTYFPILVVANDRDYVGDKTNSKPLNAVAFVYLVLLVIVAVATIPLMIITKAGQ